MCPAQNRYREKSTTCRTDNCIVIFTNPPADDERDFIVYTPPAYDPAARKRYPVLYLLHGYSDDATARPSVGLANIILDNLIARGQAKPMIVVISRIYVIANPQMASHIYQNCRTSKSIQKHSKY
jgi:enterochelin esterase-like enzyme